MCSVICLGQYVPNVCGGGGRCVCVCVRTSACVVHNVHYRLCVHTLCIQSSLLCKAQGGRLSLA